MTDANVLPPFQVSHSAVQAIQDLGGAVRIDIEDGGCCGTTYVFELVDPSPTLLPRTPNTAVLVRGFSCHPPQRRFSRRLCSTMERP